jgi:hypothetical protein
MQFGKVAHLLSLGDELATLQTCMLRPNGYRQMPTMNFPRTHNYCHHNSTFDSKD